MAEDGTAGMGFHVVGRVGILFIIIIIIIIIIFGFTTFILAGGFLAAFEAGFL
jgi:hypothetical protein